MFIVKGSEEDSWLCAWAYSPIFFTFVSSKMNVLVAKEDQRFKTLVNNNVLDNNDNNKIKRIIERKLFYS